MFKRLSVCHSGSALMSCCASADSQQKSKWISSKSLSAMCITSAFLITSTSLLITQPAQAEDLLTGQNIGIVGGAVAGGVLGNQMSGKNKALGTAAGLLGGGVVGGALGSAVDRTPIGSIATGRNIGAVGGAVAGGIAGNKLAGKKNKALGTAAGAVGGAVLGGFVGSAVSKK